jgi:putative DNA primase/helicase
LTGAVTPLARIDEDLVLSPADPLPSARAYVERYCTEDHMPTLFHHGGMFYQWTGTHYPEADPAAIRAKVYGFLEGAFRWDGKAKKLVPFQPTTTRVNDLLDALKAVTNLPRDITAPSWLGVPQDLHPPAHEIIACENGLLHMPTLELRPSSPAYFTHNALDYGYDPDAPDPERWLRFLDDLWPDDPESMGTLQEAFGYYLTTETKQQKIFMVVGPLRSGKGTIARILTRMLGQANTCAPTLASLGQNFGLAPLIDKQLAIIADARLGARADQHAIAERLLSISGEDNLTIDRKYLPAWTGKLPTRFMVMTNELPRLTDASGALARRFIVLRLTESFYGREDHDLTDRLLGELPGILNWAIEGWHRLQERGHFSQPHSAAEAIQDLEDLASPVGAFVRDRCQVAPGHEVSVKTLFSEWKSWCDEQGRDRPGTAATFGRDLRAVVPTIAVKQRRREADVEKLDRWYDGIGLS